MNNNLRIRKPERKKVLMLLGVTMLMMMAVVSNANWNASASTYSRHFDKPNIGRSVECVKVVKGCNGQGSVGSTGDTIIGNDDVNTSDSSQPMGPIDPKACATCFDELTNDQKEALFSSLNVSNGLDACSAMAELTGDDFMELLLDIRVDVFVAIDILDCMSAVDANP